MAAFPDSSSVRTALSFGANPTFVPGSTVSTPRTIDLRTRGNQHGFIRRMVSPGDIGERIKPFIFLD